MEWITMPEAWIALASLTVLEIILGIDNIIFISVLVGRLPAEQRQRARIIGLGLAMGMRILLLLLITWIMKLSADLFEVLGTGISGRDLILVGGGLFLLAKSTLEIHHSVEGVDADEKQVKAATFGGVLAQIAIVDMVFSLDSVITAVGMADHLAVMVIAVVVAVGVMMVAAGAIGRFVDEHPTVKMLALSFLVLIGTALIAEGIDLHIPKGYIYFAMAFSVGVEMLNLKVRKNRRPVRLHKKVPRKEEALEQS
ncbi:MAG TPA: TerC family protein [Woeseiaceae bacterium]|nr:TerC family protein [Woeseiaceae bacterium]